MPTSARIEARVSREQKQRFEQAAELEGVTLTDFAIASMERAARQTLQEHTILTLSTRDQRAFVQALLSPPEPNQALRRAAARHAQLRKK